ncbi:hypothetical protein SDC9_155564 [bioreactor metagenome]|uniref:Tyr recombinase domain-containing protein n=1 Tax=bioreactor metagenome TaxID=1076179 RepID=A0A645F425_9ZZZZ
MTDSGESIPLPVDTDTILAVLNHEDPAIALATSIVVFHGLTSGQVRSIQLTDIVDGKLALPDGRIIPLADPVRARLTVWLDHRAATWPNTLNPHLFVSLLTAGRLSPPGHQFPWHKAGISAQALRNDRIIQEIQATGGDARRIADLFGIGVESATRYTRTLDPDLL